MKNEIFDIKRFWMVLKRDIFINYKPVVTGLGVVFFIFLSKVLFIWLSQGNVSAQRDFSSFFHTAYIFVGIFISGLAFVDFRSKETSMHYLMLPASVYEKTLSMILLTTIGYTVVYILLFAFFNAVAVLGGLAFNVDIGFYNMFNKNFLHTIGSYLIINSILLAGAATFRKAPLVKTVLIIMGIVWGILIVLSIVAGLILHKMLAFDALPNMYFFNGGEKLQAVKYIFKVLLWITPPVFWTVTFFKIKEKQV